MTLTTKIFHINDSHGNVRVMMLDMCSINLMPFATIYNAFKRPLKGNSSSSRTKSNLNKVLTSDFNITRFDCVVCTVYCVLCSA